MTEDDYERGRADAALIAQVQVHEARLGQINGQLVKLNDTVEGATETLEQLISEAQTSRAVAKALEREVTKSNEQTVTSRTFWIGLLGFLVALAMLLLGFVNYVKPPTPSPTPTTIREVP